MKLTHWGRVTHICISKLTIIGSNNGLSPEWRQAIIWNNAGVLLIGPLGTNFSEILIEIKTFSLTKIRLKMSSAKCGPFCLGLNVLIRIYPKTYPLHTLSFYNRTTFVSILGDNWSSLRKNQLYVINLCQQSRPSLAQIIMACHFITTRPLSEPTLFFLLLELGKFRKQLFAWKKINFVCKMAAILSRPSCIIYTSSGFRALRLSSPDSDNMGSFMTL